ncbi:MAG: YidC/Oxa1 family membrane protein insertase, partial [Solirubrobacteraceae bacterium]
VLKFWHSILGSWGLSIIFLTFTIRLVILPLTFKGVKSMQALQVLQPEMKALQERYKGDKQRLNQEMMKFYQENKVNPLGSCLPLALQIPFFIALFQLLRSKSFQADIKGAEQFLFIPDLAKPLTGHPAILVLMIVLYVGTQLAATAVTAVSADKNQQRIMYALPFVFTVFIINFSAGLIVYWVTTNVWTIGQQLVVKKLYPRPIPAEAASVSGGDGGNGSTPARGKPPPAQPGDGGDEKKKPKAATKPKAAAANGGAAKPPPVSPRKKKKRSGRRR